MKKFISILIILSFVFTLSSSSLAKSEDDKGSLVIVGGALTRGNEEVYNKFIDLAGGKEKAKIAIIPVASGSPYKYSKMFKEDMINYGLNENQIITIPLAVEDDSRSEDIDESKWKDNASSSEVIEMLNGATGVWFVGGDQLRITQTLYNEDGSNTPMLNKIWNIYESGGVIGGTSAGAAIMSETMIAGGGSLGSLINGFTEEYDSSDLDQQNYGPAYTVKGLGFFKHGIIDQHFDGKARLGRLIVVNYEKRNETPFGYGVDENTALIYDNETKTIEVAGYGGITIVDVTQAIKNNKKGIYDIEDIKLSYIEGNDKYNVANHKFMIDDKKYTTIGYEYLNIKDPMATGVFSWRGELDKFISYGLVDNEANDEIKSFAYTTKGDGVALIFRNDDDTEGYWGQDGAADRYSFKNVRLDIKPIKVDMEYLNKKGSPLNQKVISNSKESKQNSQKRIYIVKYGDVLLRISKNFGVDIEKIIEINDIENPDLIYPGQKILIP